VRISVVITVRNEERNVAPLLDSLVIQEPPLEIVVVDAGSEDRTRDIVRSYARRYDFIRLYTRGGTRGAGRNFGVSQATGEAVAFIDGDCIASPFWLQHLRRRLREAPVVAGQTVQIGYRPWEELERVELIYAGFDITHPACNLAYRRDVFQQIGGFDEWFMTAEDIDLNLRAVRGGQRVAYEEGAIVYHRTRGRVYDFLRQAFWNGAGRKQLTLKHGQLWSHYRPEAMFRRRATFWSVVRLLVALLGYVGFKLFGRLRVPPRNP
jgi:glycosyltransferase involved in cell wall biosynthesis